VISGEYWSHGLLMIYIYNDGSEWIVDHIAIVTLSRFFFKLLFCRIRYCGWVDKQETNQIYFLQMNAGNNVKISLTDHYLSVELNTDR
jgi:hypothetical protein